MSADYVAMDKINKKHTILVLFSVVLIAYLIWETYWYTEVGLMFVKWHTHLIVYIYLELLVFFLYKIFNEGLFKNIFLLCGSVLFAFFAIEAFLCISGKYKTDTEKVSGTYFSPYELLIKRNPYHVWPAHELHWLERPEYRFSRETNSLGFADIEWRKEKKQKEIRILALGDSYTEGDGAPYDSSYVSLMRNILASCSASCYVMNAGTCGSDPFFNYVNLRDRLLPYHPDIVIQSIGTNDASGDIFQRGGMERFENGSRLKSPPLEPIYAISYLSRVFFTMAGYNQYLSLPDPTPTEKQRINMSIIALFNSYSAICQKNNIQLFVVFHPEKGEVVNQMYHYDFTQIINAIKSDSSIKLIDLLPGYSAYLDSTHTKASDYFWVHDSHHNSRGYKMMAETTLQNIMPFLDLKQKQQSQP